LAAEFFAKLPFFWRQRITSKNHRATDHRDFDTCDMAWKPTLQAGFDSPFEIILLENRGVCKLWWGDLNF
jgi:hypothetical protein